MEQSLLLEDVAQEVTYNEAEQTQTYKIVVSYDQIQKQVESYFISLKTEAQNLGLNVNEYGSMFDLQIERPEGMDKREFIGKMDELGVSIHGNEDASRFFEAVYGQTYLEALSEDYQELEDSMEDSQEDWVKAGLVEKDEKGNFTYTEDGLDFLEENPDYDPIAEDLVEGNTPKKQARRRNLTLGLTALLAAVGAAAGCVEKGNDPYNDYDLTTGVLHNVEYDDNGTANNTSDDLLELTLYEDYYHEKGEPIEKRIYTPFNADNNTKLEGKEIEIKDLFDNLTKFKSDEIMVELDVDPWTGNVTNVEYLGETPENLRITTNEQRKKETTPILLAMGTILPSILIGGRYYDNYMYRKRQKENEEE
jgi:hypothetical protein